MEKFVAAIGTIFLGLVATLAFTIVATFFGAVSGWIVGLFFEEMILGFFTQLGITDMSMWQLGAVFGWMGGFLKTKVTVTDK